MAIVRQSFTQHLLVSDTVSVVSVHPQKNAEVGNLPNCVDADTKVWTSAHRPKATRAGSLVPSDP